MKKLTAGIFSILLGMVAVNSADAAVASKGYVDGKVGANTASIATLTQTVADNKTAAENLLNSYKETNDAAVKANADAIADNKGLIQSNATAIGSNTEAIAAEKTARENADKAISDKIGTVAEGTTVVEMISEAQTSATYDDTAVRGLISGNASAIEALNGEQDTQDGRIDALETSLAEGGDTANAIAKALADANAYTDAEVKELAEGAVADNTAAIAAINNADTGILKQAQNYADTAEADAVASAKTYTDGEIDKLEQSLGTTSGGLTALETRVTTAEGEIDTLQGVADTVTNAATGLAATRTVAQQGVADAAAAKSAADTAQAQADKGVADAATAQAAAEAAQATANAAIPAPTGECSNSTNKCVLTYNNSAYTWEVIERGTGEVIE